MVRVSWIIPLLFLAADVSSQQNFASISFGTSIPLAEYSELGDLSANGYASPGGTIKFDAGYFPVSYFGIGGAFSFGSNYAVRDSMLNDMIRYMEENATSSLDIPGNADIRYGSGFWNYISLFLGPHFSVRPTQRIYLYVRALAGVTVIRPPDQELNISFDQTEITSRMSDNRLALGLTAGTGIRFRLNPAIALKLGVDYFQGRSRFDYDFDLSTDPEEKIPSLESDFQIRTLELTAGLAYSF
ncbi:MAG: outer membrane beta-barrel protein [Bacteroidales bacterium]